MNVSLTPELEKFVAKEVSSGMYQTASEVIRAGLRKLKADKEIKRPWVPSTADELKADILEGIAALDRGEAINGKEAMRHLKKRIKQAQARG